MALTDILEAIRVETDAEIAAIEAEGEARAAAIAEEGDRAAAAVEAELAATRDEEAATAAKRIRNKAKLEADRQVRASREAIVQRIFADVEQRLVGLRSAPDYGAILVRLAGEAIAVLPNAAVVHIDPRDAAHLDARLGRPLDVVADLSTSGGLLVSSPDGRTVHNTVEVRLERAAPHLRRLIAEIVPELGAQQA